MRIAPGHDQPPPNVLCVLAGVHSPTCAASEPAASHRNAPDKREEERDKENVKNYNFTVINILRLSLFLTKYIVWGLCIVWCILWFDLSELFTYQLEFT